METLVLDRDAVERNARMGDVIPAVEAAFAAYQRDDVEMPAKSYVELPEYNGDFRSMPAYMHAQGNGTREEWDAAAVKWVNVHPDNPGDYDLPTVMGTVIYSDPETGFPLSIMDGTELTRQRTGAAAAVATDHLAVVDATSLGIVGAGVQSYTQLEAIAAIRPIERVVVSDLNDEAVDRFIDEFGDEFDVRSGSVAEAASCDVLSTVTPVREPIVDRADVGEHTHINAMGADAAGKQELDADIYPDAKLVIDDYEQCTHSGEINVAWSDGRLDDDDLYGELGEIVAGSKSGRTDEDGISVFDSTGLAIQDVAAAHSVYERASRDEEGTDFDLLGLA